ncbi:alpha/beta fold hydrolase [Mesoterricola sediminis]|uniref:Hydrolase n=1 Tax=Mesoterricola sediminis TaxID=2927980 RepID=A0AA48KH83_9BACT|nr:alpha/beta hydrolase [Mesoterricola sediminis]BDU78128.1 hydrolase [Mesoterricola sediminis]
MPPHEPDTPLAQVQRRHRLTVLGAGGPPMLFCHGFGTDQSLWRLLAPRFGNTHQVVLMDHVGTGGSDTSAYRKERYASLDGYVEDVLEVCRVLDLRNLVYVGHSVSAMIGLRAALAEPERFACLAMVGASPRYLEDADYHGGFTASDVEELLEAFDLNREVWASHLAVTAAAAPEQPWIVQEIEAQFLHAVPAILRQFARVTFSVDDRPLLGRCPVPVLLLQSREDPIVPEAVSHYLAAGLPEAHLVFLDTAGHFAQLSAPDEVERHLRAFLANGRGARG